MVDLATLGDVYPPEKCSLFFLARRRIVVPLQTGWNTSDFLAAKENSGRGLLLLEDSRSPTGLNSLFGASHGRD